MLGESKSFFQTELVATVQPRDQTAKSINGPRRSERLHRRERIVDFSKSTQARYAAGACRTVERLPKRRWARLRPACCHYNVVKCKPGSPPKQVRTIWSQIAKTSSWTPGGWHACCATEKKQRMQMLFFRLAESALFCANFAVALAGLICLACAIVLAVTVWKLTAFSADFGGKCSIYGVRDTEPTEGKRLVRQLWHYTPFTVEKTSKAIAACSV